MLVPIFAILSMTIGRLITLRFSVIAVLAIAFGLLGLVVVVLTVKLREARIRKPCFILAGASAEGIPICALLHNFAYGLLISLFGKGFWERHASGGDESIFFILALIVCPVLFLLGTVGSIVFLIKGKVIQDANVP